LNKVNLAAGRPPLPSLIVTGNKSFLDWGEIFNNHFLTTAVLNHPLHHATMLNVKGEGYRMKEKCRAGLFGQPESVEYATLEVEMAN
jgi:hypothetical protein